MEKLKEGWVEFQRIEFNPGFIDIWRGDQINNPNNPTKHLLQLNSSAAYFRLNGTGEWINQRDMFKIFEHLRLTDLPAQMIWDNCYTEYQELLKNQEKR